MGLEPNGDWKRMQSAMLIADVTGDWMEGVVVAQLVNDDSDDNGDDQSDKAITNTNTV